MSSDEVDEILDDLRKKRGVPTTVTRQRLPIAKRLR